MGIFSKYLRAHKVTELPTTNIEKQDLYIVSESKSETFMIAVRDKDNTQWHILTLGLATDMNNLDADLTEAEKKVIREKLGATLQKLIDDSIVDHPDGYSILNFKDASYLFWEFPAGGIIEIDKDTLMISANNTTLSGGKGGLILNTVGNFFSDKNPSPKGIEYDMDYSATYTNRSLVDKGYVDKAISDIPSTNNDNKWFIGSKANPLNTPSIEIDTQGLMQGHEIVITYERVGQVELPLIESSRPDVKIELYSIDDSVNFESGAMNRIYLHLTEAIEDDTYQFDITAGKINTYANI